MSSQFITYGAIALTAWLIALLMVKPRNALDLSRCCGWYLLVFFATYVFRPAASEITGDVTLYRLLKLGNFEDHWQVMAIAVPLAILSFAIGYAAAGPRRAGKRAGPPPNREPSPDPHRVRVLIFCLIGIGYLSALMVLKTGGGAGRGDYTNAAVGVYQNNTAWFAQEDILVSTGTILYYILTGRLGMSVLLAGPWILMKIINGWGRTNLLGHFFSLMGAYFIKARLIEKSGVKSSQALAVGSGVLVVLMLFPLMGMLRGLRKRMGIDSKDALSIMKSGTAPQDLLRSYLGTNSSISGFETTLDHLVSDQRSELGTQYLYYYFIQPIPRIIWEGKGTPFTWPEKLRGIEVDPRLGLMGAAPGSIGMAYEQWGWLGIPFEFLLTGLIIRKWEEAAHRRPKALHVQLGYIGLYSLLPQLGRDSLIYMFSNFWLFKYGITVFILWRMYKSAAVQARLRERSARVVTAAAPAAAS